MGRRDASLPQETYDSNLLTERRWRHNQMVADHFLSLFVRHYMPALQVRQKYKKPTKNLAKDMLVMTADPQLPHAHWPVGRVVKLIASADGCIR